MKLYKQILSLLTFILTFSSCEKVTDGNGSILVTVKSQGKAVPQAMIYLKHGTLTNPNVPFNQYDKGLSCDASGQAYFENLPPDNYFIFAKGYSTNISTYVQGETSVIIRKRYRQNYYEITVDTK